MAKKLTFKAFEKCRIDTSKRQEIKGGYKYVPQGTQGNNFIIILADIRNANINESNSSLSLSFNSAFQK